MPEDDGPEKKMPASGLDGLKPVRGKGKSKARSSTTMEASITQALEDGSAQPSTPVATVTSGSPEASPRERFRLSIKPCRRKSCQQMPKEDDWGNYDSKFYSDGRVVKKAIGDVCGGCLDDYLAGGFEMDGTVEQVLDKCNTDADMNRRFILVGRRRRGLDRTTHIRSNVKKTKKTGLTAKVKLRGLTSKQFKSRFNKTTAQAKKKMRDLPHPNGSNYKGILVKDDGSLGSLGVRYSYKKEVEIVKDDLHLESKDHWMENQADQLMDDLTMPSRDEDKEVSLFPFASTGPSIASQIYVKMC